MKCEYCDSKLYVEKCSCGHYACGEHSMFVGQTLTACIACYEAAKDAYESTLRSQDEVIYDNQKETNGYITK